MKRLFIAMFFALPCLMLGADSVWVYGYGSGWGSSEDRACDDAEQDAEWELERRCRSEADGDFSSLHFMRFDPCDCFESGDDYYRCRTRGEALCRIWD